MSKLGLQVLSWIPGALDYVLQARPKHLKMLVADPSALATIKSEIPDCFVIYRRYCDLGTQQRLLTDPVRGAREFASLVLADIDRARVHISACEGLNETGLWNDADAYSLWTAEYARVMWAAGMPTVAYNFPTGNPSGYYTGAGAADPAAFREGLRAYWAHYLDGLRESSYLGLHEYSAPTMQHQADWLCLRYRQVWDILPEDCRRPIVITECGIDGGVVGRTVEESGWRAFCDEETYLSQLDWYVREIERDAYVLCAHIFHAGSADSRWDSFSLFGADRIAEYIRNQKEEPTMPDFQFTGDFARFASENPRLKLRATSEAVYLSEGRAVQLANKGALVYVPGERTTLCKPYRPKKA